MHDYINGTLRPCSAEFTYEVSARRARKGALNEGYYYRWEKGFHDQEEF